MSHEAQARRLPCFRMLTCFEAWKESARAAEGTGTTEATACDAGSNGASDAPAGAPPEALCGEPPQPKHHHPPHKYKTNLCTHFGASGKCRYGSKCVFAHGVGEKR